MSADTSASTSSPVSGGGASPSWTTLSAGDCIVRRILAVAPARGVICSSMASSLLLAPEAPFPGRVPLRLDSPDYRDGRGTPVRRNGKRSPIRFVIRAALARSLRPEARKLDANVQHAAPACYARQAHSPQPSAPARPRRDPRPRALTAKQPRAGQRVPLRAQDPAPAIRRARERAGHELHQAA